MEKVKKYWFYIALGIAVFIILLPFILILSGELINFISDKRINLRKLYTFGLYFKDFITAWIALGGIFGAAIGIYQMHKRVTLQGQQITLQEKQNRDSRFHSAAELLGKDGESTRISGIYSLYFLAREYPKEYLKPVCEILCAHVRTITSDDEKYQKKYYKKPANEIQTIIDLLFKKNKYDRPIFNDCKKNLERAFLNGVDFRHAILRNVYFSEATLINVNLNESILYKVHFNDAALTRVNLSESMLTDVHFNDATLTDSHFSESMLTDVHFNVATLTDVDFSSATLTNVNFTSAGLTHVFFTPAMLYFVLFDFAKLIHVPFNNAKLENINFNNAELDERVDFIKTPLEGCDHKKITKEGFSLVIGGKTIVKNF